MDHAPGANRWTRTNSESCLPRPESKTVRFNAEVGHRWGIILVTENTTDCPPKGSEFWKGNPGWDLRKCQENPKVGEIYIIIWPESCQPCPPAGSGPVIIRIRTYTVRKGPSEDSYWVRLLGSLLDHGIKVTGATKSRSLDFILCQPGQKLYISFGFLQLAFKRYNSPEKNG